MSFVVYWMGEDNVIPLCKKFNQDEMKIALDYAELLRKSPTNSHITMSCENPNMVGKQGVADPSPDYKWMKRRTC
jgi:hypothetical protein